MPSVPSTTPTLQEAANRPLPPRPKFAFNWASDSDEDDVLPTKSATTTTTSMPHHKTNNDTTSTTTPRGSSTTTKTASHKIENTPSASSTKSRTDDADGDVGLSEDENGNNNNNKTSNYNAFHTLSGTTTPTDSPAITAVARELLFHCEGVSSSLHEFSAAAVVAPRHCNEVTILAPIPYKLKSVWSGTNNSSLANTPSRTAAATSAAAAAITTSSYAAVGSEEANRNPAATTIATASTASSGAARPLRMNRALDELTAVLRQGGGSLPYDELMARSQWRSRFQPSFGSLFTFVKRNRDIFRYNKSIVELLKESAVVA